MLCKCEKGWQAATDGQWDLITSMNASNLSRVFPSLFWYREKLEAPFFYHFLSNRLHKNLTQKWTYHSATQGVTVHNKIWSVSFVWDTVKAHQADCAQRQHNSWQTEDPFIIPAIITARGLLINQTEIIILLKKNAVFVAF